MLFNYCCVFTFVFSGVWFKMHSTKCCRVFLANEGRGAHCRRFNFQSSCDTQA